MAAEEGRKSRGRTVSSCSVGCAASATSRAHDGVRAGAADCACRRAGGLGGLHQVRTQGAHPIQQRDIPAVVRRGCAKPWHKRTLERKHLLVLYAAGYALPDAPPFSRAKSRHRRHQESCLHSACVCRTRAWPCPAAFHFAGTAPWAARHVSTRRGDAGGRAPRTSSQ